MEAMAESTSSQSMCLGILACSEALKAMPGDELFSPWAGRGTAEDPVPVSCGQDSTNRGSTLSKYRGPEDDFPIPRGKHTKWLLALTQPRYWAQERRHCTTWDIYLGNQSTMLPILKAGPRSWGWSSSCSRCPESTDYQPRCSRGRSGSGEGSRQVLQWMWPWCCPEPFFTYNSYFPPVWLTSWAPAGGIRITGWVP